MALNKQWMALLIVAIMVASYGALFAFQGGTPTIQPAPSNSPPSNNSPSQTTPVRFVSESFQSTVQTVLPSVFLATPTRQANIDSLDALLYGVEGVRSLKSFYRQLDAGQLVYVADIQLDPQKNRDGIVYEIVSIPSFEQSQVLGTALMDVPKTIQLRNEELQLSQSHEFQNTTYPLMASLETRAGDLVEAQLSLELAGGQASNVQVVEIKNISAEPTLDYADLKERLHSLESRAVLYASIPYSASFSRTAFDQSLQSVSGVSGALTRWRFDPKTSIFVSDANLSGKESDLNRMLWELDGVNGVSLQLSDSFSTVSVSFEEGEPIERIQQGLKDSVQQVLQKEFKSTSALPNYELFSDINLSATDSEGFAASLDSFLEPRASTYHAGQLARVDLNEYYYEDLNQTIPLLDSPVNAIVKLGKKLGDEVPLRFQFTLSRNQAVQSLAVEEGIWFSVLRQRFD